MNVITALTQPSQPTPTYIALEAEVHQTIGIKLFTLMTLDRERGLARRCYSNMPDAYPESGSKPMKQDNWSAQVIDRHEMFVANTIEDIAAVFSDYELIQSLGCESCLNIPIVVDGLVIGTLNCLHEADHYTPTRVTEAESLKVSGTLALLMTLNMKEKS